MQDRDALHKYWKNPTDENSPVAYAGGIRQGQRSEFLTGLFVDNFSDKNLSIMEIGCGVGRNLWYLRNAGYKHLYGIEIHEHKAKIAKMVDTKTTVYTGAVEDILPQVEPVDVIFAMATLMHIRTETDDFFEAISNNARLGIITIEFETTKKISARLTGRNYKDIFENSRFEQSLFYDEIPGLSAPYKARVFKLKGNHRHE